MKFTSFHPLIVTKDATAAIALFEALGFEREHKIDAATNLGAEISTVCMKNPDGFKVDVAQAKDVEKDLTLIRINVPDFDEAHEYLLSKGFHGTSSGSALETRTNKSAMMISPSGYAFDLVQHIKE